MPRRSTIRGCLVAAVYALGATMQAHAASDLAAVTGVVRDERGTPQSGVLVELLSSARSITTFTDHHGRYLLQGLTPGQYQIRATATLFLPTLRPHLELRSGTNLFLNLTLGGLRNEASWLNPGLHGPDHTDDDWKWTLRSPVNRPLLRLVDDDDASSPETARTVEQRMRVAAATASGVFGESGSGGEIEVARHESRAARTMLAGLSQRTGATGQLASVRANGLVSTGELGSAMERVAVGSFQQVPVVTVGGRPLSVAEFGAAERMNVGDLATVEAGSLTQIVSAGGTGVAVRPFLAVRARVPGGWIVGYRLATATHVAGFDDLSHGREGLPAFGVGAGGTPLLDGGLHQEVRVERRLGRVRVQGGLHRDGQQTASVTGWATGTTAGTNGLAVDTSNGLVRVQAPGYTSTGGSFSAEMAISDHLECSGAYLNGRGLAVDPATGRMFARRSQGALVAVKGTFLRSGTRVSVAYRWQPAGDVTVLAPYVASETMPYLGVSLRQPLGRGNAHGRSTELVVDGGNLLNEGAHEGTVPQGNLLLANALREIRAGLAVTF